MTVVSPDERGGIAQQAKQSPDGLQIIVDESKVLKRKPATTVSINGGRRHRR